MKRLPGLLVAAVGVLACLILSGGSVGGNGLFFTGEAMAGEEGHAKGNDPRKQAQGTGNVSTALSAKESLFLPENPLEGSALFTEKYCIRCHSIQGIGGKTGPDLGESHLGSFSEITAALWNHFPRMNEAFRELNLAWPDLTTEETRKLITFLYYLNFFDKASNAEMGEKLFNEKNCIRCHSVGGKGGDIGPKLDPYQSKYPVPYITAALWNKGPKMMEKMRKEKVNRPEFRERDVIEILGFIRSNGLSAETTRSYLSPGNPIAGRRLFDKKKCSYCHSIRGKGGKIGPDLSQRNIKGSLSYILSQLWNHGSNMWPRMTKEGVDYPKFEPEEMSNLISYLYFIKFDDGAGSVQMGERVFAEKNCKTCHIPEKPGEETIGPDLAEAGLENPFDILSAMWNHAPTIQEKMEQEKIRWPLFKKEEMKDLLEYILSLKEE